MAQNYQHTLRARKSPATTASLHAIHSQFIHMVFNAHQTIKMAGRQAPGIMRLIRLAGMRPVPLFFGMVLAMMTRFLPSCRRRWVLSCK